MGEAKLTTVEEVLLSDPGRWWTAHEVREALGLGWSCTDDVRLALSNAHADERVTSRVSSRGEVWRHADTRAVRDIAASLGVAEPTDGPELTARTVLLRLLDCSTRRAHD